MNLNKINEKILEEAEKQYKEGILNETEFKKSYNINQQSFDLISYFISKNFNQIRTDLIKTSNDLKNNKISISESKSETIKGIPGGHPSIVIPTALP